MPLTTSVVLCTFNGARFLAAQWASLLAQTRLPDAIVVRDDASTDATPRLLEQLAADARARGVQVHLTRNPHNLGYVANFEAALRDASGELVFLCDQDDVWHADKLAMLAAEFEQRPALLLMCSDARRVDANGASLQHSVFDVLRVKPAELRRIHAGAGFDALLRRSLATGATIALRCRLLTDGLPFPEGWVHDEWLAIIAAALGGFDCLESELIDYRQHADNELGMPERGWRAKWRDLRNPRADLVCGAITRMECMRQRMRQLGGRVLAVRLVRINDKLDHLRVRQSVMGAPWRRIGPIAYELMAGRYRRYGSGWRSALRDLVRR